MLIHLLTFFSNCAYHSPNIKQKLKTWRQHKDMNEMSLGDLSLHTRNNKC